MSTATSTSTFSSTFTSTLSTVPNGGGTTTTRTTSSSTTYTHTVTTTGSTTTVTTVAGPSKLGIVVPMYMDPGSYWTQLEQAKLAYPSVPVIAIINPDNGPGPSSESSYVSGIKTMQADGIIVLGYVDTQYAGLSKSQAENQVSDYYSWYKVNGMFFDEMQNSPGDESYYTTLSQYTYGLGMTYTMGNPGTATSSSYIGTVNNMMIYENNGLPSASTINQYSFGGPPSGYSMIASDVSLPSQSYINSVSNYVSYVWFTSYQPDYQELPSTTYLNGLMAECAAA